MAIVSCIVHKHLPKFIFEQHHKNAAMCRFSGNLLGFSIMGVTHGKVEPALDLIGGRRQGFFILTRSRFAWAGFLFGT
jgi:hypothetical protein